MKVFDDVKKFMEASGQLNDLDSNEKEKISELYKKLIDEEYNEFIDAYKKGNDEKMLDGCFDLMWVIIGYMLSRGWDCSGAWEEGSNSNLAKIDSETGKVIRREDGKILKPSGWKDPDFKQFV